MQGAVWSCITCGVQYTMHQSMWKSFRDAVEMHWKSAEFNMQGHTLTLIGLKSLVYPCTVKSKCVLISYPLQLEDSVYNPLYNLPIGGFLSNYLSHLFWNPPFRRIIHFILCIWRFYGRIIDTIQP